MGKPRFFSNLEGCFSEPEIEPLHKLSPEEIRAMEERPYLEKILQGSKYRPEDVIGVALGVTHGGKGVQLRHVYLTERGMREQKDPQFSTKYAKILEGVAIKIGSFLKQSERGALDLLAENYRKNKDDYVDFKGLDNQTRVLVIFSRDINDFPSLEAPSTKA